MIATFALRPHRSDPSMNGGDYRVELHEGGEDREPHLLPVDQVEVGHSFVAGDGRSWRIVAVTVNRHNRTARAVPVDSTTATDSS